MARRVDRQGEVLIWCRKCSDCARQRMGPKLVNCYKPEQVGTKEYGKMLKRIQILEDGRVPTKEARNWKIEGQNTKIVRKEYKILLIGFRDGRIHGANRSMESRKRKMLQDRGALPKEVGDVI